MRCMGEPATELEFDVADRLRKALRYADVGVGEMADYLGISRQSVGRYINGHVAPDRRTLRLWAIRCRVPFHWLVTGDLDELPRMDSNHQPAGYSKDLDRSADRGLTRAELLAFRKALPIEPGIARPVDLGLSGRPL